MLYAVITPGGTNVHLLRLVKTLKDTRRSMNQGIHFLVRDVRSGSVFIDIYEKLEEAQELVEWVTYEDDPCRTGPPLVIIPVFGNHTEISLRRKQGTETI